MKKIKRLILISLVLSMYLLPGCKSYKANEQLTVNETTLVQTVKESSAAEDEHKTRIFAMDTVMQMTAYGEGGERGLIAAQEAIERLEGLVSVTDENSEIFLVNNNPGISYTVSEETAYLIENALNYGRRTNGALDVSIYPIVKAWGFTTGVYQVPSEETISALLEAVNYNAIDYNTVIKTVSLSKGMQIDLGAIAKGYAGDLAIESMKSAGVTSALISLGGNIQALGTKPDGSLWQVAVQNPENKESYAGVLEIENKAVVTSGGYERYFVGDDGEIYWHIFDPTTGRPAHNGLISVTIVGDSGMLCDMLSTSLFVMGLDNASAQWREYGDFEAVFITESHEIYITEGLENSFSPLGIYENSDIRVVRK